MKALALSILTLVSASAALATTPMAPAKPLTHVEIDGKLEARYVAFATIDETTQTISLRVINDMCGQYDTTTAGQVKCMAMGSTEIEMKVPYTVQEDGCGSKVYSGYDDKRPVDGISEEIEITDNSKRVCENVIAGLQVVKATRLFPRGGSQKIYAFGNEPVRILVASGDEAIYNSLNVQEVALNPGIAGVGRFSKTVGRLTCLKEILIVPPFSPKYRCSLK